MATAEHTDFISVVVVSSPAPGQVQQRDLQLPRGACVRDALQDGGMLAASGDAPWKVGVWGQLRALDHVLRDRDRVEVYRPLMIDPKDARRLRHRQQRRDRR
ncbi:MAG: RnfH family protein [Burkholderiales bacterium PBB1]|nr:MAG: RnfH family protein [Burkholderiales bacterium PBB1]